jgi:hypothetical protein
VKKSCPVIASEAKQSHFKAVTSRLLRRCAPRNDSLVFSRVCKSVISAILIAVMSGVAFAAAPQTPAAQESGAAAADAESFVSDCKGQRDPFAPPGKGSGGIDEISSLKLEGIISDKNGMCAVIGGQVVKEGDRVFTAEVLTITNDSVTLQYGKERIELKKQRAGEGQQTNEE